MENALEAKRIEDQKELPNIIKRIKTDLNCLWTNTALNCEDDWKIEEFEKFLDTILKNE